jgi:hypothetical protein
MSWLGNSALELAWQVFGSLLCVGIVAGGLWLASRLVRLIFPRGDR